MMSTRGWEFFRSFAWWALRGKFPSIRSAAFSFGKPLSLLIADTGLVEEKFYPFIFQTMQTRASSRNLEPTLLAISFRSESEIINQSTRNNREKHGWANVGAGGASEIWAFQDTATRARPAGKIGQTTAQAAYLATMGVASFSLEAEE